MTGLISAKKRNLCAKAHNLKPIVIIGNNGLTKTVTAEIDRALFDHQLIKVKITGADKKVLAAVNDKICITLKAECVQMVGHIVILYRKSSKFS